MNWRKNADPMGYGVYLTRFIRQGVALFVKKYRMFGLSVPPKVVCARRSGVAMREVVVVLALILVVFILGAPFLLQLRTKSRRAACEHNLRLVGLALAEHEQQQGSYPGYRQWQLPGDSESRSVGWVFTILPYLRTNAEPETPANWGSIYDDYGPSGGDETKGKDPTTRIWMLVCPSAPATDKSPDAISHFVVNGGLPDATVSEHATVNNATDTKATDTKATGAAVGDDNADSERPKHLLPDWPANGLFLDATHANSPRIGLLYVQERDGADSTLLLSENTAGGRWCDGVESELVFMWDNARWANREGRVLGFNQDFRNTSNSVKTARASSFHVGGANVVFVSGATRFVSDMIDQDVFVALMASENAAMRVPGELTPLPPPFGSPQADQGVAKPN